MAVSVHGGGEVATGVQRDAEIVVSVRIFRIAGQRFHESVYGRNVLSAGVVTEAKDLISLGVLRIHAEGGAGFGDGVGAIVETIEDIRQAAVVLGKVRHQLRGG